MIIRLHSSSAFICEFINMVSSSFPIFFTHLWSFSSWSLTLLTTDLRSPGEAGEARYHWNTALWVPVSFFGQSAMPLSETEPAPTSIPRSLSYELLSRFVSSASICARESLTKTSRFLKYQLKYHLVRIEPLYPPVKTAFHLLILPCHSSASPLSLKPC